MRNIIGLNIDSASIRNTVSVIPGIDSYTKLMLHMDGPTTTFTDSSLSPKTVTVNGGSTTNTTDYKFGPGSADLSSLGSYLSLSASTDWNLSAGDGCVDCWVYRTASGVQQIPFIVNGTGNWYISIGTDNAVKLLINDSIVITGGVVSASAWHHLALAKSSGTTTLYLDGSSNGSTVSNLPYNADQNLRIATATLNSVLIDEFRFSNGVPRFTSNFTPPTAPYST